MTQAKEKANERAQKAANNVYARGWISRHEIPQFKAMTKRAQDALAKKEPNND